jgi:hypothetical protein
MEMEQMMPNISDRWGSQIATAETGNTPSHPDQERRIAVIEIEMS